MRSHHLAAIEMARLVPTRATHPELKALAQAFDRAMVRAAFQARAAACKLCGDEWEQHGQHGMEHCRDCAEACRRCERACKELTQLLASYGSSPDGRHTLAASIPSNRQASISLFTSAATSLPTPGGS